MSVIARRAGPSRWGRPQEPVKGVPSTWNLGSPRPSRSSSEPDGLFVRWIRINIQKPANDGHKAKNVNIRVPIAVVKGGMRLGAIIGTFAGDKAARRMKAQGLDIDLAKISSDLSQMNGPEFDEFLRTLHETNIEIDDGKAQVRITAE